MRNEVGIGNIRIFYSPEFQKGYKEAAKRHKSFDKDFDRFLKCYLNGDIKSIECMSGMPKGCQGFNVSKFKKFRCSEINKGSRSGYRIIYSEYRGCVLFVQCYFKANAELEDRKLICNSLSTVRDGSCKGHYVEQTKPKSREIFRN